jgi:hypothetical protein
VEPAVGRVDAGPARVDHAGPLPEIGFKAVELAHKAAKGEPVANVDTGARFYDSTNMDRKDIAQLLYD